MTAQYRHVAFDSVRARVKTKDAKDWCHRYGLQDSATFAFALYDDALASTLALEWCRRMQWYFDRYIAKGVKSVSYTQEDHQSYTEGETFLEVVSLLHDAGAAFNRAAQIRKIRPFHARY